MARPTLDRNVKFKRLCRELALPKPYVRGLLETMWDCAHECGNPVLGDLDDIEAAAEWPGERGAFSAAVVAVALVDAIGDDQYEIHDYWDHAPDYVKKRRQRELEREDCGEKLKATADNGRQRQTTADNGKPPAPAPAPAHKERSNERSGAQRFSPPTVDDVADYCRERNNSIDATAFIDYYEARGWMLARTKMRDWRAAVRTWEKRGKSDKSISSVGVEAKSPWHPDDYPRHENHPKWQDYMDAMAGKPGPWPRFERWLNE